MIYDDLVAETLIEPLPAIEPQPVDEAPAAGEAPPTVHDAIGCDVCQAWLAHVRDPEHI